ncbi:putative RNA recognition motif domain-containing protein [Lupinus albus]|uniref:Putative RNA recognition motif domain-containing protein n=1 Tax=Lupinus albus TaxID=3870 RepID=A0A6A4QKL2_LUPAL|nr:putative RNA recognition motif domain-containing protein [Lupinus albus]
MRRNSPGSKSPPRRGYGGRGRKPSSSPSPSPPPTRRGHGGDGGRDRRRESNNVSLLVRNIPLDCRSDELRIPFERFGRVCDVYIPKDYYSGGCWFKIEVINKSKPQVLKRTYSFQFKCVNLHTKRYYIITQSIHKFHGMEGWFLSN